MIIYFATHIFFFAVWAQLSLYVVYRGIYGDYQTDTQKFGSNLSFLDFYRKDTTPSTKVMPITVLVWVLMMLSLVYIPVLELEVVI